MRLIAGINTFKDCISTGYPFIESILSALPLCDRYFVNDGGSSDGTLEALKELCESYPKVKLYQIPDTPSVRWDCVSDQLNTLIQEAGSGWVFLGNADELLHEEDTHALREYILRSKDRIIRLNRREITYNWGALSGEVYHPARITKNIMGVRMDWNKYGGDEFLFTDGWHDPKRALVAPFTLYHLYNLFPLNQIKKLENDALRLSPGDSARVKAYERLKNSEIHPVAPKHIYPHLPILMRDLAGAPKYHVRRELFDPEWVSTLTGLKY